MQNIHFNWNIPFVDYLNVLSFVYEHCTQFVYFSFFLSVLLQTLQIFSLKQ